MQPCDPTPTTTITTAAPTPPSESVVRYLNGSFSVCSASCGYATKSRRVLCVHTLNGVHTHVDDSLCPGTKPEEIVVCEGLPPCSILTTTAESDAMTTVARTTVTAPIQTTMIQITTTIAPSTTLVYEQTTVYINDETTTEYFADPSIERPTFVVGQYGECDCSSREKTRYVLCVDYRSNMVVMIAEKHCYAAKQVRPDNTTACNANECPGTVAPVVPEWSTTGFEECSRTCGGGVRRRQVVCVDSSTNEPLSDDLCDADQRPQETEDCAINNCEDDRGSFWSTGKWSDCSVTCGLGHQRRPIVCYYFEGVATTEISTECDIDIIPSDTRECDMGRCHGYWVSTEWSECSASCGFGIQSRTVDCRWQKSDLQTIDESQCEGSKPDSQIGCKVDDCPLAYACNNMLKGSGGNISSPLYPNNYPNDVTCKNILVTDSTSSNNSYIEINFQELEIEEETDCNFDYIEVYDVTTGVTDKICTAAEMPKKWTSQGNMVEVTFVSDASINKKGYSASWKMIEN
ncbi:papilin-like isoform X2 [Anneissia japonica]|uniref:papilin-like isoform X2 n=1 Tax=Anneissia japonica TaxID=1529436 RepID=UPI001425635B|nr:papilin-like isoform X2 [Anneissia japonica]